VGCGGGIIPYVASLAARELIEKNARRCHSPLLGTNKLTRGIWIQIKEIAMHSVEDSNRFSSVTASELAAVEGGIVAFEYLLVATILGLALVMGVSAAPTQRHTLLMSASRA
jgi:hypothetical protein